MINAATRGNPETHVDIGAVEIGFLQPGPTFTVTNTAGHDDGACTTDDCTFLEALNASNANADANTIIFAPALSGIISTVGFNANTGLGISNPVTISGGGVARIFQVTAADVVINGLTLSSGSISMGSGGAISNSGGLTLQDCRIFSSNAIGNDPVGFGGGIYSALGATLTLNRCTVQGNAAGSYGGGVYTDGVFNATNCTFYNNTGLRGGGIIARSSAPTMTLHNCTIAGNSATDFVNMAGFGGGGVYAEGGAQQHFMANCIVSGNSSTNDPDVRGQYTTQGHNLITNKGDSVGFTNGVSGDIVGFAANLNGFGNNGGPTDTYSLLTTSPAINDGDNNLARITDQRGFLRSGVSDIGAWEFNATVPPAVSLTSAVSRKLHGGAIPFDVNLPLAGGGVECRGAGGNHTIIFTFSNTLTNVGSPAVTSGAGYITNAQIGSDAHQYIVDLTGVSNAQSFSISLGNVTDSSGNYSSAQVITFGLLQGDVNEDRFVNAADATVTRNGSGQTASATNFRADVNVDGTINAADATTVRNNSGSGLPQADRAIEKAKVAREQ